MIHQGIEYYISTEEPPVLGAAQKKFGSAVNFDAGVVFAYAPNIHVKNGSLDIDLVHHETTHFKQQERVGGPAKFWEIYLKDEMQRLNWELEAYREQYQYVVKHYNKRDHFPRLRFFGQSLLKLYGIDMNLAQAIELIKSYPHVDLK